MNKNVGSVDRTVRALGAVVLVVAGVLAGASGWSAILLYGIAAVLVVTAAVASCPLYSILGLRTCPLRDSATNHPENTVAR